MPLRVRKISSKRGRVKERGNKGKLKSKSREK
jgi:hypothetical protein